MDTDRSQRLYWYFLGSKHPLPHMAPPGTGALEQTVLTLLPTKRMVGAGKV